MGDKYIYDSKFIPNIFGAKNNGTLCYLNSLIQALLSCPAFNKKMLENEKKFTDDKNWLGQEYISLYKSQARLVDEKLTQQDLSTTKTLSTTKILQEMIKLRCERGLKDNLQIGRQEDIEEGLMLMLEVLGEDVSDLFQVRHDHVIRCRTCKNIHKIEKEPSEHEINLSDNDPVDKKPLDNRENIQNYIKRYYDIPTGYSCDCGAKNTKNTINIIGVYVLRKISPILILRFTGKQAVLANIKFNTKGTTKDYKSCGIYFPEYLEFQTTGNKNARYEVVAQVEQFGYLSGGHYTATCKRPCERYGEKRMQRIKKQLADPDISKKEYDMYMEYLKKEEEIEADKKQKDARTGVFLFNDERMQYTNHNFENTRDTYLVFYHLVGLVGTVGANNTN
jgi:ubiquitin C-terminal hydrolase